jgi:hypothetical protein
MQHLAAAEALLSQNEDVQGTQVHRIDYEISVINRNQRNQSMPAPIRTGDHLKQPSSKWIDYSDYTDYDDYADASDYAHYSNEPVSGHWFQTQEPDPLPTDASLHFLSETGDLLTIEGRQT